MPTESDSRELHPVGEDPFNFQFVPGGGKFHLSDCDEQLTAYGGLVAWDHFLQRTGMISLLAKSYPLARTSPNATPVGDILQAFVLNCLIGGKRFAHSRRLQDDQAIVRILGLSRERLCGEDAFRRLCAQLTPEQTRAWMRSGEDLLYNALPQNCIADWDSTVTTRYGHQEDVAVGYNPHKPGRPSHHPLVCVIGGTRLALHMAWRKGNTVSATAWQEAMEEVWSRPQAQHRIKLNRGDIGFGQEKVMAWHEKKNTHRPHFLFKLKLTKNVKRAIQRIAWPEWNENTPHGLEQYAEIRLKIQGWSTERRVVVSRTFKPLNPGPQDDFWIKGEEIVHAYVTNLPTEDADAPQIIQLYRDRGDCENVFDELKNQWGFSGFCSGKAVVSESAARLLLITYNLWSIFARVLGGSGGHTEAITSRYELLMLPGRLVMSGRSRSMKLAVGEKLRASLKAAYQRLQVWLETTAPHLTLTAGKPPPWSYFDPAHHPLIAPS